MAPRAHSLLALPTGTQDLNLLSTGYKSMGPCNFFQKEARRWTRKLHNPATVAADQMMVGRSGVGVLIHRLAAREPHALDQPSFDQQIEVPINRCPRNRIALTLHRPMDRLCVDMSVQAVDLSEQRGPLGGRPQTLRTEEAQKLLLFGTLCRCLLRSSLKHSQILDSGCPNCQPPVGVGRASCYRSARSAFLEVESTLLMRRFRIPRKERSRFQPPPMPLWLRLTVLGAGWILILVGLVGLFLPVFQGMLSLALGLALMSAASQTIHLWLRNLFARSPRVWKRMERVRRKMHGWFERWGARPVSPGPQGAAAPENLDSGESGP